MYFSISCCRVINAVVFSLGTWLSGTRNGAGDIINNHFTYHGYFTNNLPQGPGKMIFTGCQQLGEYVMNDVFVRKNGMLETEQEPTWRCTELVYSGEARELPGDHRPITTDDNDD